MTVHKPVRASEGHQPYRFSTRDYRLLSDHGAFDDYAKTELIEGVIYAVNAQYSRHLRIQTTLLRRLADACEALDNGMSAWIEGSIAIDNGSMPRPDIFVVRELPEDGPVPVTALFLVIEVSDSSLEQDLGQKAHLYAAAGVPEYWVADVNGRVIHQMWAPDGGKYGEHRETAFSDSLTSITIERLTVDTSAL